jgi:hypothetical protein
MTLRNGFYHRSDKIQAISLGKGICGRIHGRSGLGASGVCSSGTRMEAARVYSTRSAHVRICRRRPAVLLFRKVEIDEARWLRRSLTYEPISK